MVTMVDVMAHLMKTADHEVLLDWMKTADPEEIEAMLDDVAEELRRKEAELIAARKAWDSAMLEAHLDEFWGS